MLLPEHQQLFARGWQAYLTGNADSAVSWLRLAATKNLEWAEGHMALGERSWIHELTMNEVRALRPAQAKSAVSFKTGEFTPDFHAFETDNFILLPWDREIIQGGEL